MEPQHWPRLIAAQFSPAEEAVAADIAQRYAAGGRRRRSVLQQPGERSGGFGVLGSPGELALVLDALAHAGAAVLRVLENQAIGNVAAVAALVVQLVDRRRARGAEGAAPAAPADTPTLAAPPPPVPSAGSAPPTAGSTAGATAAAPRVDAPAAPTMDLRVELSPVTVDLVDAALTSLSEELVGRGHDPASAWQGACTMLTLLHRDPADAAGFVRSLGGDHGASPAAGRVRTSRVVGRLTGRRRRGAR